MHLSRWFLLATAAVLFAPVRTLPQTASASQPEVVQSDQVLRANTRLVVVDVVATDKKGQRITDLKPDEFSLRENGTPQKISNFSFHAPVQAPAVAANQLPPDIVTNTPSFRSSSLNVMLIDSLNGDFAEQAYVKNELIKYLTGAQLECPLALFALESRLVLLHDFTVDVKSLKSAAERFKPPATFNNADTTASRASAFPTYGDFHTNELKIETTLNQLNALAKTLSGYPGRKNLIWLSESFPVNLYPDIMIANMQTPVQRPNGKSDSQGSSGIPDGAGIRFEGTGQNAYKNYDALIKKVSDNLMSAQVAIYVVDAGAVGKDERLAAHHTMNDMAERTGGRVFHTNNLAAAIHTSVEDGSSYYTLEYYPDNKSWDGQFRTIHIDTKRPGINLRYRVGYYALDPEKMNAQESAEVAEAYSRALQLDAPAATSILFQSRAVNTSGKKVVVTFHVDPTTLAFQEKPDGHLSGKFSCTVWAYGKNKDKPAQMSSDTWTANLNRAEYQAALKQRFLPCTRELDLKSGDYTLRLGVLDRTTNKIGTVSMGLNVP